MSRILLLIDHKETSQVLGDWLAKNYEVIQHAGLTLGQPFDLCLVDGPALDRHGQQIQACKKRAQPVFLPCLLIRGRRGNDHPTRGPGQAVDELIDSPIEKVELQVRVESLLRARQLSMEIQRREEQAWQAQQRLRFLLSSSPAVIYTCQPFGDFAATFITDNVTSQMGYLSKDFIGQPSFWIDHVHPEDRSEVLAALARGCAQGRQILEYRFLHQDGSYRWMHDEMRLVRDPAGQPLEIVGYWIDISPRKLAEEALRKSQANLEEAQAMARLGSWEHDLSTQRISWSREMFTLFDRNPALGPPSLAEGWELIHPEDRPRIQDAYAHALNTGQTYIQEFRTNPKEGQPRHMVGVLKNVEYAAGKPVRLIGTTQDITERKQLEDYLRQLNELLENRVRERTAQLQEANAELQAFSYSVSHDLRGPLRAMSGLSQIVLEDYGPLLDETARKHLQGISQAALDMDDLIHDLLAYSRLGRAEATLGPVDLTVALTKAQAQLAEEFGQAELTVSRPLPTVIGHEGIMVQVLANLLSNAVKFVAPNVRPQIRIWAEQQEKLVRLWVEDNGIGIAPEHQERIFQVFERLHSPEAYPGTGIGLAIVRKGMARMQGQVGLVSRPGQGSRFWIELLAP